MWYWSKSYWSKLFTQIVDSCFWYRIFSPTKCENTLRWIRSSDFLFATSTPAFLFVSFCRYIYSLLVFGWDKLRHAQNTFSELSNFQTCYQTKILEQRRKNEQMFFSVITGVVHKKQERKKNSFPWPYETWTESQRERKVKFFGSEIVPNLISVDLSTCTSVHLNIIT